METAPGARPPAPRGTGPAVLAAELRTALLRAARRLRAEKSDADVSEGQYSVLALLDRRGPSTPRELAALERVQPPSMTRTIAALLEPRTRHPQRAPVGPPAGARRVRARRRRLRPGDAPPPGCLAGAAARRLTPSEREILLPRRRPPRAGSPTREPDVPGPGIRNYRLWVTGAIVSNTGTWMQRVAQDWLVLDVLTANSGTAVGITTGLQFLPMLLLTPIAGALADRVDRRKLLAGHPDRPRAARALALGVLDAHRLVQLWHVYVLALLLGTVSAVDAPARQAFVIEMVPTRRPAQRRRPQQRVVQRRRGSSARAIAGLLIAWSAPDRSSSSTPRQLRRRHRSRSPGCALGELRPSARAAARPGSAPRGPALRAAAAPTSC